MEEREPWSEEKRGSKIKPRAPHLRLKLSSQKSLEEEGSKGGMISILRSYTFSLI